MKWIPFLLLTALVLFPGCPSSMNFSGCGSGLSGCGGLFSGVFSEPPVYVTVEEVLDDLEEAWDDADAELYAECLHPDRFSFIFPNEDVEAYGLPESWGYQKEIETVTAIFENGVEFELYTDDLEDPPAGSTAFRLEKVGYYFSGSTTPGESAGDAALRPLEGASVCDITLEFIDDRWFITEIRDYSSADTSLEEGRGSWGLLRALYDPDFEPAATSAVKTKAGHLSFE